MNSYTSNAKFIKEIADHLGVIKNFSEPEEMYLLRVIYSATALMGLAACYDINDDDEKDEHPKTVSLIHVKKRMQDEFEGLCKIYFINGIEVDNFISEIYFVYKKAGFYYHKNKRVAKAMRRSVSVGKLTLIRSPMLSENFLMSGAGYYKLNESSGNDGIIQNMELFGLEDYHLKDIYDSLMDNIRWELLNNIDGFEFFSSRQRRWSNDVPKKDDIFFGKRENQKVKIYYLFKIDELGNVLISELPEVFDKNICLAFYGYWFHKDLMPKIIFGNFGDNVYVRTEYILPKSEKTFFMLMSWPAIFREKDNKKLTVNKFCRIMNKNVFSAFKLILESRGYQFKEEVL